MSGRIDFVFVNNIRFLAMISIIAVHSYLWPWSFSDNPLAVALLQVFKFGTLSFFMISGYLLGTKIEDNGRWEYYKNRLNNTFVPWLFWSSVFFALVVLDPADGVSLTEISNAFRIVLFDSNYWFIPNFFLALGILLIFRRFFSSRWFGGVLLVLSLAYAANMYGGWVSTQHTTALLGYVFYLWLGVQIHAHKEKVIPALQRIPYGALIGLIAVMYGAALTEAWILKDRTPNLLSTLRFTNQLYSLSVFALLMKLPTAVNPRWMDVRKHTYGLFLIHWILVVFTQNVLSALSPDIFKSGSHSPLEWVARIVGWAACFAFIYLGSWKLTELILRTPMARLVGGAKPKLNA